MAFALLGSCFGSEHKDYDSRLELLNPGLVLFVRPFAGARRIEMVHDPPELPDVDVGMFARSSELPRMVWPA